MNSGSTDILVAKYNSSGVQLWIQQFSGLVAGGVDFAAGMAVTDTYVYLTGAISNNTVAPETDMVTMKLATGTGTIVWSTTYDGGTAHDAGKHVVLDGSGNVYVTGASYNASFNTDFVTVKYNSSGTQQWVSRYDYLGFDDAAIKVVTSGSNLTVTGAVTTATANVYKFATLTYAQSTGSLTATSIATAVTTSSVDVVTDIATDGSGNVIVIGSTTASGQANNMYVQKLAASNLLSSWTYTYNGASNLDDIAKGVATDASSNVYIAGYSTSSTTGKNITLIKLNSSGVNQWTQTTSFSGDDEAVDLVVDASSNLYLSGYKYDSSTGSKNYYTAKYNSSGTKIWEVEADGHYYNDYGTNLALDSLNNVIVTGQSETSSTGDYEFLTVKYAQYDGQLPIDNITAENPNNGYLFYENKGQVLNTAGTAVETTVSHTTMDCYPKMYFMPKQISYLMYNLDTLSTVADTAQRIDIVATNALETAKSYSYEKAEGVINIFDSQLLSTITDVQGYRRIIVPNLYTGIDAHYYSNNNGFKIYYVVKAGAEPRDIKWTINGATSTTISGTNLVIKGINNSITYDQPNFYQTNAGGTTTSTLAAGTWTNVGSNQYKFNLPAYNNTLPLIIELDYGNSTNSTAAAIANLEFCTFYGGALDDNFRAMKTNSTDGSYVVVGSSKSWDIGHIFPTGGSNTSANNGMGYEYMVVVKFDSIGVRKCANIYGSGTSDFIPLELVVNETTNAVTIVGNSFSSTLPAPNAPTGGTYSQSAGSGFVVQFQQSGITQSLNQIKWSSRLNGYASGISMKPTTKDIYITTSTKNTTYAADLMTKTNAYNKSTSYSKWHYQISKFDHLGNRSWATYFPAFSTNSFNGITAPYLYYNPSNSVGNENYLKCKIDCDDYGFTIAGETKDTGLVIMNRYHRAIDSTHNGGTDGFIARFNSNDSIVFSGYVGGSSNDGYNDLKYANPNLITLTGFSQSTQYKNLTYRSNSSQYIDTVMPTSATKMLITKIDSTGQKIWSTFYGNGNGAGESCAGWSLTNDSYTDADGTTSRLIVTGVATNSDFRIAATNPAGVMNNTSNLNCGGCSTPGYADAFMLTFTAGNVLSWNTYFGGSMNECGLGVEYNSKKNRIMLTGFTNTGNVGSSWAKKFPTCYTTFNSAVWYKDALNASNGTSQIYAGYIDGFVGWFNGANIVGIEEYFNDKTATIDLFNLYPNPTNGNSYIAFKNKLEGQTTIEIYSITGQLVYSNVKNSIFDRTVIELPTANLSNAMYIVNVKNENTTVSKKLIINK